MPNDTFVMNTDVYKYDQYMNEWIVTGQISEGRVWPAVTVLPGPEVAPFCAPYNRKSSSKNNTMIVDKETFKNIFLPSNSTRMN